MLKFMINKSIWAFKVYNDSNSTEVPKKEENDSGKTQGAADVLFGSISEMIKNKPMVPVGFSKMIATELNGYSNLPFGFGGMQRFEASKSATTSMNLSNRSLVSKLTDGQQLYMIYMPFDVNAPAVLIPNANNTGRYNGRSSSRNGGDNNGDGVDTANHHTNDLSLPIIIHIYEVYCAADGTVKSRRLDSIGTDIVPSQYDSWKFFAGAVHRFWQNRRQKSMLRLTDYRNFLLRNGLDKVSVAETEIVPVDPSDCWPGFEPNFGVFVGNIFCCYHYRKLPWNAAKQIIQEAVMLLRLPSQLQTSSSSTRDPGLVKQ